MTETATESSPERITSSPAITCGVPDDPEQSRRLENLLNDLARAAGRVAESADSALSATMLAELAEFLHHWSGMKADDQAAWQAGLLADQAMELLGSQPSGPHWIGGFTGTARTLRGLLDDRSDPVEFTHPIDQAVESLLAADSWSDQYDLISGLAGYGLYGLEHPDPARRSSLVSATLRHLERLKQQQEAGITWFTPARLLPPQQREQHPAGYHNLGLAHGIAGVIGFLARCVEENVHTDRAAAMLKPATEWLLTRDRGAKSVKPGSGIDFSFANVVESPQQSRTLAWCYGDLGITPALQRAGRALDCPHWQERALNIARHCAHRRGPSSSVVDAGLCHGSAGAALIFHRWWQVSRHSAFAEASHHWLMRTPELLRPEFEMSGGVFTIQGLVGEPQYLPSLDRLTGLAGVGLALLTCLCGLNRRWDAPLLTDIHSHSEDRA